MFGEFHVRGTRFPLQVQKDFLIDFIQDKMLHGSCSFLT
jgi:hypothetical protein